MFVDANPPEVATLEPVDFAENELRPAEQSRCVQAIRGFSVHVLDPALDYFGDSTTPTMIVVAQDSPTRISDSKKYWGERLKTEVAITEIKKVLTEGGDLQSKKIAIENTAVIEPLQTHYDSVKIVVDNETIKIAYGTNCEFQNVVVAAQAQEKVASALQKFGIGGHKEEHILLLSTQLPVVESWYNEPNDVTVVGCKGIEDFTKSDVLAATAHEEAHSRLRRELEKLRFPPKQNLGSAAAILYEFLDEGTAVYAQQTASGITNRVVLRENLEKLHPRAKAQLLGGMYSGQMTYVTDVNEEGATPNSLHDDHIHTRIMPGAFVEYSISKGYTLQDFIRVTTEKFDQVKDKIAEKLGMESDEVSIDEESIAAKMRNGREKNSLEELDRLLSASSLFTIRPFEALGMLEGSNEEDARIGFLSWVQNDGEKSI